ncbi:hypothetical protein Gohar_005163 [Gossypium harknessii]|uniref:Uncharacterized protein n=1 Tax=Gossypium harknessii TaxID=34285 RepID=A0A7J9H766_9ROSI|nr:hypothetical protein [Gossypium harknessii]
MLHIFTEDGLIHVAELEDDAPPVVADDILSMLHNFIEDETSQCTVVLQDLMVANMPNYSCSYLEQFNLNQPQVLVQTNIQNSTRLLENLHKFNTVPECLQFSQ